MQEDTYQTIYRKLLSSQQLQPLNRFKGVKSNGFTYPDANTYPQFFHHNLSSEGRVIKVIKGNSVLLRAFSYQILKLSFQIQAEIDYVQVFKSVIFHPLLLSTEQFQSPTSGRYCTDHQYKRILAQFIQIITNQTIPNIQLTLLQFPIIAQALTRCLQNMVKNCYEGQHETFKLLQWLASIFNQTVQKHGKCYRYLESDIFIYQENSNQFYLAFLSEMAERSDNSSSTYKLDQGSYTHLQQQVHEKYRNSARPPARKQSPQSQQYLRKTVDNLTSNEAIEQKDKCVEQSSQNQKNQKQHSRIGSLLQYMSSEQSSKQQDKANKTQFQIIKHKQQKQSRKTIDLPIKQEIIHPTGSQTSRDRFVTQKQQKQQDYYNPFIKKYSEIYMNQFYGQNMKFGKYQIPKPLQTKIDIKSQYFVSNKDINQVQNNIYNKSSYSNQYSNKINVTYTNTPKYQHQEPQFNQKQYLKNQLFQNQQLPFVHSQHVIIAPLTLSITQPPFQKQKQQDIFYRPSQKPLKQKVRFSKDTKFGDSQDSKGTIYRQFTDTKVLKQIPSFQRQRIQNIRKKYKGVHRRDLVKRF